MVIMLFMFDDFCRELKLDKFERFVRCMDDSIKHFLGVCHKVAIYHRCSRASCSFC